MAQSQNYTADVGATFTLSIVYRDAAGALMDLTGYTGTFKLREPGNIKGDVLAEGTVTLGGAAGTITVKIADEVTTTFSFRKAAYYLDLTSPTGDVTRLLQGILNIDHGAV